MILYSSPNSRHQAVVIVLRMSLRENVSSTVILTIMLCISPGISPGAPLELLPDFSTLSNVPAPAAGGFSGLVVHEKIHLCMTNLLQMTFEIFELTELTSTALSGKLFHRLKTRTEKKYSRAS